MTSYFEAFKDLLFPPLCLGCEQRLESSRPPLFCADCLASLAFIHSPCCRCCGVPFFAGVDHLCGDCLDRCYAFDFARSLLSYQPPVSTIIRSLKFGGHLAGMSTLGALTVRSGLMGLFSEPDLILPVPLHPSRLRQRGFNQALIIARGCFPQWQDKIEAGLLVRLRATPPQSFLTGKDRRRNLKKVFSLVEASRVTGKKVLVVDDVFTTGSTVDECSSVLRSSTVLPVVKTSSTTSTVDECSSVLRSAGAARIEIFTLARSLAR